MEKVANIPKIKHLNLPDDAEIAINCEWGAFDSEHHEVLPRTKYDIEIDETSNKPGEQAFEKMIAGLYLGEVRFRAPSWADVAGLPSDYGRAR